MVVSLILYSVELPYTAEYDPVFFKLEFVILSTPVPVVSIILLSASIVELSIVIFTEYDPLLLYL